MSVAEQEIDTGGDLKLPPTTGIDSFDGTDRSLEELSESELTSALLTELAALPCVKNFSKAGGLDDGKNPVEALCSLTVRTAADAWTVVQVIKKYGRFGAMGKGALTSAIGALKTHEAAEKVDFLGFVAISIDFGGGSVDGGEGHFDESGWEDVSGTEATNGHSGLTILREIGTENRLLIDAAGARTLRTPEGHEFRVIEAIPGKLDIYLSKHNQGPKKHRYRVYGGLSPARVDAALKPFGLTTHNDLTTREKAPWASTLVNASEGRTRRNVANSLLSLRRVDEHGIHTDVGEAAKINVGLLGATGLVMEATHEAEQDGTHEFGVMVYVNPGTPIDLKMNRDALRSAIENDPRAVYDQLMESDGFEGRWIEGLQGMDEVVEGLRPYGTYHEVINPTTKNIETKPTEGNALVRGEEIVQLDVLLFSLQKIKDPAAKQRAVTMAMTMIESGCTTAIMVDGKTDTPGELAQGLVEHIASPKEKLILNLQALKAQSLESMVRACLEEEGAETECEKHEAAYAAALTAATTTGEDGEDKICLIQEEVAVTELNEESNILSRLMGDDKFDEALSFAQALLKKYPLAETSQETVPPLIQTLKRLLKDQKITLGIADGASIAMTGHDCEEFREIREATAEGPRSTADIGISGSLDSSSATTGMEGTATVNARYLKYMLDRRRRGYMAFVYGHVSHRGINWHGRSAYPVGTRERQEMAAEMKDDLDGANAALYADLIANDGIDGIDVRAGEKGIAGKDLTFFRYLELVDPELAEQIYQALSAAGLMFASRSPLVFHAHPLRMKNGILNRFVQEGDPSQPLLSRMGSSIVRECQKSHRDVTWGLIDQEMYGQLRDWFELKLNERIFVKESFDSAVHAATVNVVDFRAGETCADWRNGGSELPQGATAVLIDDPAQLDDPRLEGIAKIVYCKDSTPLTEAQRAKAAVIVYSAQNFGDESTGHPGGPLGIMITNTQQIIRAHELKRAGNVMSSLDFFGELNATPFQTAYTPDLETRAELAATLAYLRGERSTLDEATRATMLQSETEFVTMNPGPSQGNPGVIEHAGEVDAKVAQLREEGPEAYETALAETEASIRAYFEVPDDYEIVFARSATEMMQHVGISLDSDKATVLSKGAFGVRQAKMVGGIATRKKPHVIKMRWGRGENSERARVLQELQDRQGEGAVVYMTENETSTGVQMNPSVICGPLDPATLTVVDATSDIGSRKPQFLREDGTPQIDVYFGSGQKVLGVPGGGICMAFVSKRAMNRARLAEAQKRESGVVYNQGLAHLTDAKRAGNIDVRKMLQLGVAVDYLTKLGGVETISATLRDRVRKIYAAIEGLKDLVGYVPEEEDRSEVMATLAAAPGVDIAGVGHELKQKNKAAGAGYGVLKAEQFRLLQTPYLTEKQFDEFLAAFLAAVRTNRMPGDAERHWNYSATLDHKQQAAA